MRCADSFYHRFGAVQLLSERSSGRGGSSWRHGGGLHESYHRNRLSGRSRRKDGGGWHGTGSDCNEAGEFEDLHGCELCHRQAGLFTEGRTLFGGYRVRRQSAEHQAQHQREGRGTGGGQKVPRLVPAVCEKIYRGTARRGAGTLRTGRNLSHPCGLPGGVGGGSQGADPEPGNLFGDTGDGGRMYGVQPLRPTHKALMLNQAYKEGIIIKATIKKVATGFLKIRFQSRANNFQVFFILFTSYPHHSYLTCNFLNFLNIIEAFSYFMTADLKITQYTILSYFIKKF